MDHCLKKSFLVFYCYSNGLDFCLLVCVCVLHHEDTRVKKKIQVNGIIRLVTLTYLLKTFIICFL